MGEAVLRVVEEEKKQLTVSVPEPEQDYTFIENLLQKDFRSIYNSLSPENRRAFWRNTIRQIHLKSDYTVDFVDFI